ncbi:phage late control D family protein [Roseibium marinum]|uniref:Phage protein D n=1 Tax=Roseibium marinum TaxID=281252 RepID=A0A2S3UN13_9HYPH|nr:contractile injection system protein, VgrG/Pvc8 family [Roseibium marinum]POF29086.1 phage protein D [Roseibium marinum]
MPVLASFLSVTLEGIDITDWVTAASVTEDDRRADEVTVTVADPQLFLADCLIEGSEIEVDLGYAEPNGHALLIRAVVTKVEVGYGTNGLPQVSLKGSDGSIRMGYEERKKKWKDTTVTAIVREIGERHGFTDITVRLDPDPDVDRKPLHQDGKTDLAFLQELARKYKAKCFVELNADGQEALYFIPERDVLAARRVDRLPLRYRLGPGSNLLSFSAKFDVSFVDRQKALHDVDDDGNDIVESEDTPPEIHIWYLDPTRLAVASPADRTRIEALYTAGTARKRAFQAEIAARRLTAGEVRRDPVEVSRRNAAEPTRTLGQSGSGSVIATIFMRAKSIVTIDGCAERDNGEWYVNSVTHAVGTRGFTTSFNCTR